MRKYSKTATGIAQMAFTMPKPSWDVNVISLVPYDALVTKIKIEYIKVPRAEADAAQKQSLDDFKEKTKKAKSAPGGRKGQCHPQGQEGRKQAANG